MKILDAFIAAAQAMEPLSVEERSQTLTALVRFYETAPKAWEVVPRGVSGYVARLAPTKREGSAELRKRIRRALKTESATAAELAERLGVRKQQIHDQVRKAGAKPSAGEGTRRSPYVWRV